MKKSFTVDAKVCSIVLSRNGDKKTVKGTHAGTHDDFEKEVPVHLCHGYIGGVLEFAAKFDKWDVATITDVVENMDKMLKAEIYNRKSQGKNEKEINEALKKLGFV